MPILHIQFNAHAKDHNGQLVEIPHSIVLQQHGPYVQVVIKVAQSIAKELVQQGQILPEPISGI